MTIGPAPIISEDDADVILKAWVVRPRVVYDTKEHKFYFASRSDEEQERLTAWDVHKTPDIELIKERSRTKTVTDRRSGKAYTYYPPSVETINYLIKHQHAAIEAARRQPDIDLQNDIGHSTD